jgi:hypothetical protein
MGYPCIPPRVPPRVLSRVPPIDRVWPRTSVGARPHVVVEGGEGGVVAVSADDVDGAGGVDHRRVPSSRGPRRAGRAARPRDTCSRTRATTGRSHRTQPNARGRNARRGPSYKYRKPTPCDGRERKAPRRAQRRSLHTRAELQSDGIARTRTCTHRGLHAPRARARAQMDTNTHMSTRANAHAHCTRTHMHAHARAPETPVEDPAQPLYPLSTPLVPLFYPLVPPRYPLGPPFVRLSTPLVRLSTPLVPLHTPSSTLSSTPRPPPLDVVRPRTSVGARPHVVQVGAAAAVAADDVDGAGGVDHGRVVISRGPRRAGRAARPRDTCGRTRATTGRSRRTQPRARGRNARRGPSYKYRKPPCDGRARRAPRRTHALATHARGSAIRWNRTNPHMRSQRHAYTHGRTRARKWTQTHT